MGYTWKVFNDELAKYCDRLHDWCKSEPKWWQFRKHVKWKKAKPKL